jgi:lipopolysaccharide transport system permease protein
MKTVISSSERKVLQAGELRYYSGLLRYLSLRDVFVRYKQTWLGFGWSLIRPAVNILIFGSLSYLVERGGDFSSKFVTVSAGIVFWQLLSTVASDTSNSLTANSAILTKVYFPKILLPVSTLLVALVDFAIAFVFFLIIYFSIVGAPTWRILLFPLFTALGLMFSFSLGLAAATASVRYRDVRFILPFFLQILFYASPVFLSSEFILGLDFSGTLKVLYQLNPLVFIINGFKFCFFGHFDSFDPLYAACSLAIVAFMLFGSVRYFNNFERTFADYI